MEYFTAIKNHKQTNKKRTHSSEVPIINASNLFPTCLEYGFHISWDFICFFLRQGFTKYSS